MFFEFFNVNFIIIMILNVILIVIMIFKKSESFPYKHFFYKRKIYTAFID